MRRNYCQACSFARYGVKTRKEIDHTCDGSNIPESPKHPYIPTREELNKYLAKLKELMEPENRIPRRNRLDFMTPAEKAIQNAVWEVEKIGADVTLTEAVILLQKAKELVANFIDKIPDR